MGNRDDPEKRTLSLSGFHQAICAVFVISERAPRGRDVNLQPTTTHLTVLSSSGYLPA